MNNQKIRKHRGLKRYYRNLQTKNDDLSGLNFTDPDKAWFDLWHIHFDNWGFGNQSFKRRKPHLDKLFRHFDLLAEKAKSLKTDYQIWIMLLDFDSNYDALYLHTPNPNRSEFPYKIPELSLKSNFKNKEVENYINGLSEYRVYYAEGREGDSYCVLFKENIGIPLL